MPKAALLNEEDHEEMRNATRDEDCFDFQAEHKSMPG